MPNSLDPDQARQNVWSDLGLNCLQRLSAEDTCRQRSKILYFHSFDSLQSYVREQVLQTVAVILKRGTLDSKGARLDGLFQDVTQLISSGNVTMVSCLTEQGANYLGRFNMVAESCNGN